MEVLATSIYYRCTYEIANVAHMSNNAYFTTLTVLSATISSSQQHRIRSFTKPSRNIFTCACPWKTSPCKASLCTRGAKCWRQIFHTTWLHFIGDPHRVNTIMDFGRIYFKAQKSPYSQKWCRSPWSKIHGDIISSGPIVRTHGTTSHFWLMIQAHESHWGNFGSRGLEGQEVCSVKLQWFKVDKEKHVAWHVFPNFMNSDGSMCNR